MGASSVWGMMRTARLELTSRVRITCMDMDPAVMVARDGEVLGSQLRDEVTNAGSVSTEVAYRDGVRYCRKLHPSNACAINCNTSWHLPLFVLQIEQYIA